MLQLTKKQSAQLGQETKKLRLYIEQLLSAAPIIDDEQYLGVYANDLREVDKLMKLLDEDFGVLMGHEDLTWRIQESEEDHSV